MCSMQEAQEKRDKLLILNIVHLNLSVAIASPPPEEEDLGGG